MTAALYAQRNGKTALVLEKNGFGGQITYSPKVENFPGRVSMSGNEFATDFMEQLEAQGAEYDLEEVTEIVCDGDKRFVKTLEGSVHETKAVIIANGVKHRMLGLEGEYEFVGNGISFCAVCDGDFYKGLTVCVAGGGNSALQEAILLAGKCKEVIMLQDLPTFTGEQKLQYILFARDNVRKYTNVKILGIIKDEKGGFAGVKTNQGDFAADGLFEAIGLIPENGAFAEHAELNKFGYFDSAEDCTTKTPGIFVAGDCRSKGVRQLTTAVADGATAAIAACRYIDNL